MMLDSAGIEARLPHGPAMCLLEAVVQWDEKRIHCIAKPPDAAHALARDGSVPAVAAIELAAQAAAVHGALRTGDRQPRAGLLAKISEATLGTDHLPTAKGPIQVRAEMLSEAPSGCRYGFEVRGGDDPIAHGCLIVTFPGARRS